MKAFLILIVLLLGGAAIFIFSGFYNVAASDPHYPIVRWVLETTRNHSIHRYAEKAPPPPPREKDDIEEGFKRYDEMCIVCHSAPGFERREISKGLNPEPPDLSREVLKWSREELFWIAKHGLKMSGMPAFGPTHSDKDIADIIGFLARLPDMSPQRYMEMRERFGKKVSEEGAAAAHRESEER